ncbi:MAG: hypothetical protein ACI4HM_09720 [Ruminococcus sp.]
MASSLHIGSRFIYPFPIKCDIAVPIPLLLWQRGTHSAPQNILAAVLLSDQFLKEPDKRNIQSGNNLLYILKLGVLLALF